MWDVCSHDNPWGGSGKKQLSRCLFCLFHHELCVVSCGILVYLLPRPLCLFNIPIMDNWYILGQIWPKQWFQVMISGYEIMSSECDHKSIISHMCCLDIQYNGRVRRFDKRPAGTVMIAHQRWKAIPIYIHRYNKSWLYDMILGVWEEYIFSNFFYQDYGGKNIQKALKMINMTLTYN